MKLHGINTSKACTTNFQEYVIQIEEVAHLMQRLSDYTDSSGHITQNHYKQNKT